MIALIEELKSISKQKTPDQPAKDKYGWYYFSELPQGTRQATMMDLESDLFKHGTPYLLYGNHSKHFECHIVDIELHERLLPFIEAGRVFLWT